MNSSAASAETPRAFSLPELTAWRAAGLAYFGLLTAMSLPVLVWPIPHSFDLVNHWARLTLLRMAADDPLRAQFAVQFGAIPNLGVDLIYLALSPALSPQSVARLAFALSFWLPAWGAFALHRALFAAPSPTIGLAPVLSYNLIATGGIVNYGLGLGLALLTLAWAETRRERRGLVDIAALNLAALAIFFCHLIALAAYLVAFAAMEAAPRFGETWRTGFRRALASPLFYAPALGLVALAPGAPTSYQFDSSRLQMLIAPFSGMDRTDATFRLLVLAVAAVAALRGLTLARPARWALVALGLFALAAPPSRGAASMIDARLAVGWVYFLLAAVGLKTRAGPAFAIAIALLAAFRLAAIMPTWSRFDADVASLRGTLQALAPGARAIVVTPSACAQPDLGMLAEHSVLGVIDRRAGVNALYAAEGMQPVRRLDAALDRAPALPLDARWLTPEGRREIGPAAQQPWADAFVHWRDHFDAVVYVHGRCPAPPPAPGLVRVSASPVADVYLAEGRP